MSEKNIPREIAESKPNFEVKEGIKEEIEYPKIDPDTLDAISDLAITDAELEYFGDKCGAPKKFKLLVEVLKSLSGRNIEEELPVEEKTFKYQRNLAECKKLKVDVYALLNARRIDSDDPKQKKRLENAMTLLALETRKAAWLQENYYPIIFERALAAAKGEVMQFLIRQKNTALLDKFKDLDDADIVLKDDLIYLLDGHTPQSVGEHSRGKIALRVPDYYTKRDEWRIYLVLVHELLHFVSEQESRVGLHLNYGAVSMEELNEAITNLLTFEIAQEHLEKEKTMLSGERKRGFSLHDLGYSEYTVIVKQIFVKIPVSFFKDAVLNQEGLERLQQKFAEVFGKKDALIEYGRKLRDLYSSFTERRRK